MLSNCGLHHEIAGIAKDRSLHCGFFSDDKLMSLNLTSVFKIKDKSFFSCICPYVLLSLNLFRLGVHAGFPWIPGHLRHGEEQECNATEKEEDKASAGTSKGPAIVVFDPNCLLALDHALH